MQANHAQSYTHTQEPTVKLHTTTAVLTMQNLQLVRKKRISNLQEQKSKHLSHCSFVKGLNTFFL